MIPFISIFAHFSKTTMILFQTKIPTLLLIFNIESTYNFFMENYGDSSVTSWELCYIPQRT